MLLLLKIYWKKGVIMPRNASLIMPEGMSEQEATQEMSELKEICLELRGQFYPPTLSDGLVFVDEELPIWAGNKEAVKEYHLKYKQAFDLAHKFYPQAALLREVVLPAKLMLPQFRYNVTKLSISKNVAKESKTFGSVGALINRCGSFDQREVLRMDEFFLKNPSKELVCHREFVDFRARMHTFNVRSNRPDKNSFITQFYTTGLVVAAHDTDDFQVVDNRKRKLLPYSNAYKNPIADNGEWKVYIKKVKVAKVK